MGTMRRYLKVIIVALLLTVFGRPAHAQTEEIPFDVSLTFLKFSTNADFGFDVGVRFHEHWGVKAGLMADLFRNSFGTEKALDEKYRLSYTAGATYRIGIFTACANVGYGEYGTYAYSSKLDEYGIKEKIRGVELGLQMQFVIKNGFYLEVGYGTIPQGFVAGKPFHDITFGFGINLVELFSKI